LESLGKRLKAIYLDTDGRNLSIRKWIELKKLMDSEADDVTAIQILFPDEDEQYSVLTALNLQDEQLPNEEDE
jgi:hypothetical protein